MSEPSPDQQNSSVGTEPLAGPDWLWILLILLVALLARGYFFFVQSGIHYPDELFQYLEPAHAKLTGNAWLPWEYVRGLRNWVLPAFFGSWMALFREFGLSGETLQRALWANMILLSLALLPAGWRIGEILTKSRSGAFLSALFVAACPTIAWLAPHTLSENFGVIFSTWAIVWWLRSVTGDHTRSAAEDSAALRNTAVSALFAGILVGCGIGFRFTLIIFLAPLGADYLFRWKWRELLAFGGGVLFSLAVFGLIDLVTWGTFLHSIREFIEYNVIEKGNRDHGVMSWHFYLTEAFWSRWSWSLALSLPLLALSLRRTWRLLLVMVVFVLAHSLIGHKEERFILSIWPLFAVSVAIGLWQVLSVFSSDSTKSGRTASALLTIVAIVAFSLPAIFAIHRTNLNWRADMFAAQDFVGDQPDATGLMYSGRIHLNGGYFIFDRNVPQTPYKHELLDHDLFNYLALEDAGAIRRAEHAGFEAVRQFGDVSVYRRQAKPQGAGN
jgi:hypothetical protein